MAAKNVVDFKDVMIYCLPNGSNSRSASHENQLEKRKRRENPHPTILSKFN